MNYLPHNICDNKVTLLSNHIELSSTAYARVAKGGCNLCHAYLINQLIDSLMTNFDIFEIFICRFRLSVNL